MSPVRQDVIDGYHEALDLVEAAQRALKAPDGDVEASLNQVVAKLRRALGDAVLEQERHRWANRPQAAES